jgi:hypothetical protein
VAALLDYAAQTERAHGLPVQAPNWLARPTGWLHGEALGLVERLFSAGSYALIAHAWECEQVALDLLAPVEEQLRAVPTAVVQAARGIARVAAEIAAKRNLVWTEARLVLTERAEDCHPDDTWCRVTLETHSPFHRVDAWVNDRFDLAWHCWLPIRFWPDAAHAVRGPLALELFAPDAAYRHWRRRMRRRWLKLAGALHEPPSDQRPGASRKNR